MDAVLVVQQITEQSKLTQIEQAIENSQTDTVSGNAADAGSQAGNTVSDNAISASAITNETLTFDIAILDSEGNEIQPDTTKGEVRVTFANVEVTDAKGDEKDVEVFHVDDELKTAEPVTAIQVDAEKQEVEIAAEHFSMYTIVIHYDLSDNLGRKVGDKITKFEYKWGDDGADDAADHLYYWDKFFSADATTYNPSLATTSMAMTQACSGAGEGNTDPIKWSKNGIAALKAMGFTKTASNATNSRPGLDTIGITSGYKMIDTYTMDANGKPTNTKAKENIPLIMVGIRGSNYQGEWGGNFNLNAADISASENDHNGFYIASQQVIEYLDQYIKDNPELAGASEIKIWITGFSRAAATTNMTAARIDREIGQSDIVKSEEAHNIAVKLKSNTNLYAYTFETPSGGVRENRLEDDNATDFYKSKPIYSNIHNVINPADLVPMVAPEEWGFGQYGINHYLPTAENHSNYKKLVDVMWSYNRGRLESYKMNRFTNVYLSLNPFKLTYNEYNIPSVGIFMNAFVENLANNVVKSRTDMGTDTAQTSYQASLREVFKQLMTDESIIKNKAEFTKWLISIGVHMIMTTDGHNCIKAILRGDKATLKAKMPGIMVDAAKLVGIPLTMQKAQAVVEATDGATDLVYYLFSTDFNKMATLIWNEMTWSCIETAHSMTLEKMWLESMDENYHSEGGGTTLDNRATMLSGEYRIVRIYSSEKFKNILIEKIKVDAGGNETKLVEWNGDAAPELLDESEGYGQIVDDEYTRTFYMPIDQNYRLSIGGEEQSSGFNQIYGAGV